MLNFFIYLPNKICAYLLLYICDPGAPPIRQHDFIVTPIIALMEVGRRIGKTSHVTNPFRDEKTTNID